MLTEVETNEVSLVDKGANLKRFALVKRDPGMTFTEFMKELIEKGEMPMAMDEASVNQMCQAAGLDPQAAEAFKAIVKLAGTYADNPAMKTLLTQQLPKILGGAAPGAQPPAGDQKPQPGAPPAAAKPPAEGAPGAQPPPKENPMSDQAKKPEEMQKALDDQKVALEKSLADQKVAFEKALADQKAELDKLTKRASDAEVELKKQKDEAQSAMWLAKVQKDLAFMPGDLSEIAKELKELADVKPELAQKQFDRFKAAAGLVEKSDLLKGAGGKTRGGSEAAGSAMEKLTKIAEGLIEKSGSVSAEVAKAIAFTKACDQNPQLYDEYIAEQDAQ